MFCLPPIAATAEKWIIGEAGQTLPGLAALCPYGLRRSRCCGQFHFEMGRQSTHVCGRKYTFPGDSLCGLSHERFAITYSRRCGLMFNKRETSSQAHRVFMDSSDGWPRRRWSTARHSCRRGAMPRADYRGKTTRDDGRGPPDGQSSKKVKVGLMWSSRGSSLMLAELVAPAQ